VAEGGGFGFGEGAEFAGAEFNGGAWEFVRKRGGFGTGALGKRENVEVGEGEAFDERHGGGVVVFGFAGEAGDDVGADGRVGEAFVDKFDATGVMLGAIPAVHGSEDAVGGGLQGHVEMLGDAIGRSKEVDEVLGDVQRLDGADAETLDRSFAEDAAEEGFEFDARRKIAAVGAEVDAAENDFAETGFSEAFDFMDDGIGREAAALATDERDNAVGAAGIAAVLDFESGTSVIPFSAEDGGGEEFGAIENVAGKNPA
jgi:hypothetical protein